MSQYLQLHLLTAYPPSNPNRDDLGHPKKAMMGGVERMRISSQSLKRAWRTSALFEEKLQAPGLRTRRLGRKLYNWLQQAGMSEKQAFTVAQSIMEKGKAGKLKQDKKAPEALSNLDTEQLVHFSHRELADLENLCTRLGAEQRQPEDSELELFSKKDISVDIALFGRMLASAPDFNIEAACQVSHAIGVTASTMENDFFSAVDDDLVKSAEETGAGHIGDQGFGAALYYTYVCLSRDLLLENLGGNEEITRRAIAALTETAIKVSPSGKQNSFASRVYADYVLAEIGTQQPRSLAVAFYRPVTGQDQLATAIKRLREERDSLNAVYGSCASKQMELCVPERLGSFGQLQAFVSDPDGDTNGGSV